MPALVRRIVLAPATSRLPTGALARGPSVAHPGRRAISGRGIPENERWRVSYAVVCTVALVVSILTFFSGFGRRRTG